MVYHEWGEKNFDWKGLDEAGNYIGDYCKKYARLGGQIKEKFGQLRFYAHFGGLSLHTLMYPGYAYSQFPKWLWTLDIYYIGPFLRFLFGKPFAKWQTFIYSRSYNNAIRKWRHLRTEILCGADYPELIKGVTRIEETETERSTVTLGWDGEELSRWTSSKK